MDENKAVQNTNPGENGEKTFTQEQVNAIIGERLAKEKSKADAAFAEKEQQLAQRELTLTAKERLNEMDLPIELLDALNISSQEALEKSLTTIKNVFEKHKAKPPVFRGFQPGAGIPLSKIPHDELYGGEQGLRKAMQLP